MTEQTFKFSSLERASREYLDSLLDGQEEPFFTGLPSIDSSMGGLMKGELCIIGGRPSHGKSMFALNWLFNVCANSVNTVLISEEMGPAALAQRALSFITDTPRSRWRDEYEHLYALSSQFWENRGKVVVVESVRSIDKAVSAIAQAVEYSSVEFAVVDYLQLLKGKGASRYEQISNVSTELKHAAVKYDIAMVVLAQLGREIEKRDNIPRLYDLKDSGQIEQDADQVMFVQWPLKNDPRHKPFNEYRVFCAKNRNRETKESVVELRFVPSRQLLKEVPVQEPDATAF
jgi:replicative DNA helicase